MTKQLVRSELDMETVGQSEYNSDEKSLRRRDAFKPGFVVDALSSLNLAGGSIGGGAGNHRDNITDEPISAWTDRLQESGILPLTIRLPKSGSVHQFHRLMTTQQALTLEATFVHLPMSWLPVAAVGRLMFTVGGVALIRFVRF